MAQMMPLPLTVCCFSKIQIDFTFLVPLSQEAAGEQGVDIVCEMLAVMRPMATCTLATCCVTGGGG